MDVQNIQSILDKHEGNLGSMIAILQDIQDDYGYLPEEALRIVSEKTGRSMVEIYGVATFYKSFSLKPRGKHLISVCLGTACHVRNSPKIIAEFERKLGIKAGDVTSDKMFSLETVNCLGACALGPIVVIDGHYFSNVKPSDVSQLIDKTLEGLDKVVVDKDERVFPVKVRCPRCNHSLLDTEHFIEGHPSVRFTYYFKGKHGSIRLSSLYGSPTIETDHEIPENTVMNFFCPHCAAEMKSPSNCTECGAPMIPMIISEGGMIQICARKGCKNHMLDVEGTNF